MLIRIYVLKLIFISNIKILAQVFRELQKNVLEVRTEIPENTLLVVLSNFLNVLKEMGKDQPFYIHSNSETFKLLLKHLFCIYLKELNISFIFEVLHNMLYK